MRLVVVAGPVSPAPRAEPGDRILTLAGVSSPEGHEPEGLLRVVEAAAARVRARFPTWLWDWVNSSGALNLAVFDSTLSWWWYAPLSEKSPFRSAFVQEVYWLTLLRSLLETGSYHRVLWIGGDRRVAAAAGQVSANAGARFETCALLRQLNHLWRLLARAVLRIPHRVLLWFELRMRGFSRVVGTGPPPDILLFSHFPVLWERAPGAWTERMFGTWPATLDRSGKAVAYPAIMTASLRQLRREGRELVQRCREQRVWILDAAAPLAAILRAYLPLGLYARYAWWRHQHRAKPVSYDGVDIGELLWRELDGNVFGADIGLSRMVADGLRRLVRRHPSVRAVFHPFEYQPIERAVWAGAKSARDVPVIGLQTGLFTSNQMGFTFPPEESRVSSDDVTRAPVPDFLVAYGELPHRVFADRLGGARVCLAGPLRYPELSTDDPEAVEAFREASDLPADAAFVLLATGALREEALPLLHRTFAVVGEQPNLYLLVKYHYHLPLCDELSRLARQWPGVRYRVFFSNLYRLMRLSRAVICAGSSIGIEAIACGRMPLVYHHVGQMSHNPMLHVPDAVFFWQTAEELRLALHSTLSRDAVYLSRVAGWENAIRAHLWKTDGSPDARLAEFLAARGVL